ncbi:MAG: spore maturation protein [Clostridia bacterium]|nr:spore maturation protein [Clostridia bacterium]
MLNRCVSYIVPLMIILIIICGLKDKKDVFKLFVDGALEGLKIVYSIFPYILAITIAMYVLKDTGALNILLYPLKPILTFFKIPDDIIPLCIMRPLSGGASTSIVMEIFKNSGPDSVSGKMASIIMGATETTFYTVTILLGAVNIKKTRGILIAGILADICAIVVGIILVNLNIL